MARGSDEAFVPLDEGLAVIARHARDLGYDALVLFLDELILWLATHAADLRFLNEEGPKVSKLVEAETAGRAVPIVSFVARQRDLRELVGEQVTGAHTPADDLARLKDFRGRDARARTLVWLPSFLSPSAQRDLGTLARIDHVLAGERLRDFATHLSPVDQASARELLRNQQSQLKQRLVHYLEGAYGVENPIPGSVDESHPPAEHFQSLDPAFEPRPARGPACGRRSETCSTSLARAITRRTPTSARRSGRRRCAACTSRCRAVQEPEGRVAIDKPLRPSMAQIAVPLRLGEMGETHFAVGRHWFGRFERLDKPLTVGKLREAMDDPRRMGLPAAAANLVILVYADQANLAFRRHGGPWPPRLDDLPDDLELREEALPAAEAWTNAVERAGRVFGLTVSPLRNASNVNDLAERLGEVAAKQGAACDTLVERLVALGADFSIDEETAKCLRTARASRALVQSLTPLRGRARIEKLAETQPATSLEAMGTSIGKSPSASWRGSCSMRTGKGTNGRPRPGASSRRCST